jgi:hypothetical protein
VLQEASDFVKKMVGIEDVTVDQYEYLSGPGCPRVDITLGTQNIS